MVKGGTIHDSKSLLQDLFILGRTDRKLGLDIIVPDITQISLPGVYFC